MFELEGYVVVVDYRTRVVFELVDSVLHQNLIKRVSIDPSKVADFYMRK